MDSRNTLDLSHLKKFISSLQAGNISKLIESNQIHSQEKTNTLSTKLRQCEDENTRQRLILQQNSHLIEKFQNQLQELSKENSEFLEQKQILTEENEILTNELHYSENKFAELDIYYDEQVDKLSQRITELETAMIKLETAQTKSIHKLDQSQSELFEELQKSTLLTEDFENKLRTVINRHAEKMKNAKSEVNKLNEHNETLKRQLENYEERIKDLQNKLVVSLDETKKVIELKSKIEKISKERDAQANEYRNEKSRLNSTNEELKLVVEDLKKKLTAKEKETEEVYLKFKQIARFGASIPVGNTPSVQSSKYSSRKRPSVDDPKPIQDSSDSDGSSISFYKLRKKQQISSETDDDNIFDGFKNGLGKNQKPNAKPNFAKTGGIPSSINRKRPYSLNQHVEIPESPVVSSSAVTHTDLKL